MAMGLAEVAYHLSIDPGFEASLRQDPQQALSQVGLVLGADELLSLQLFIRGDQPSLLSTPDDGIPIDPWLAS